MIKKPIAQMTKEERNEYNRVRYASRTKGADNVVNLTITIQNCPDDLKSALITLAATDEVK